jgi:hypothetical protein
VGGNLSAFGIVFSQNRSVFTGERFDMMSVRRWRDKAVNIGTRI